MSFKPIYVEKFSPEFKATSSNSTIVASRLCLDIENEPPELVASYPVDSGVLMENFNLEKSVSYKVNVSLYDFTSDKELDESVAVRVGLDVIPILSIKFYEESPLRDIFSPEYVLSKFGKVSMRRSGYCELLKHFQKQGKMLYFSGLMEFEANQNSNPGNGVIRISANIPPLNYLFGHLHENKLLG